METSRLFKERTERELGVAFHVQGYMTTDAFDFARKSPLLLNSIPEANDLKTLYSGFALLITCSSSEADRVELINVCDAQISGLKQALSLGLLDSELLLKGITPGYRPYFAKLLSS